MLELSTIAIALLTVLIPFSYVYFKEELRNDARFRVQVSKGLTSHDYLEGYRFRLDGALGLASKWMGNLHTLRGVCQGLATCLMLALIYPSLLFLTSWVVGGPYAVGGTEILPSLPLSDRVLSLLGTVAFCISVAFGGALAGALAGLFAYVIAGSTAFVGTFAVALPLAVGLAFAGASAFFGIFAFVVAGSMAFGGSDFAPATNISLLFLFVLPLINMLLDWPSWWVSRWLGHHLLHLTSYGSRPIRRYFGLLMHILIDLNIAILLLLSLAMLLPLTIEIFNIWVESRGNPRPFEIRPLIDQAIRDPWPHAIWILMMLFTPLVPTLLHVAVLIVSPLAFWLVPDDSRTAVAIGLIVHNDPNPSTIRSAAWHQVRFWLLAILSPILILALLILYFGILADFAPYYLAWAAEAGLNAGEKLAFWFGWI